MPKKTKKIKVAKISKNKKDDIEIKIIPKKLDKKDKKDKKSFKYILREYLKPIFSSAILAIIINIFIVQGFKIPSGSMEDTLLIGDFLFANKFIYRFTEPKQGDVIIFRFPYSPDTPQPEYNFKRIIGPIFWDKDKKWFKYYIPPDFIKRVIGVPGDVIEIVDKIVYINGFSLQEDLYTKIDLDKVIPKGNGRASRRDNVPPTRIPDNHYFVMGDNRDNSHDSRFGGS